MAFLEIVFEWSIYLAFNFRALFWALFRAERMCTMYERPLSCDSGSENISGSGVDLVVRAVSYDAVCELFAELGSELFATTFTTALLLPEFPLLRAPPFNLSTKFERRDDVSFFGIGMGGVDWLAPTLDGAIGSANWTPRGGWVWAELIWDCSDWFGLVSDGFASIVLKLKLRFWIEENFEL